jgi:hypothetical protein
MGKKSNLNSYLKEVKDVPFEWGVHDCFTFTNGAFQVMYGKGYADDWKLKYMCDGVPMRRDQLRKTFKHSTIQSALSEKLTQSPIAPFGSLVTTKKSQRWITGVALGISLGSRCVFLSKDGLILLNTEDREAAWVLKCQDTKR